MKIRSQLVVLVLGALVPILAFSGVMLVVFNRHTREATERGLVETARALSVAVDQQVTASTSVLEALATSEPLRAGNLEEFDRAARAALATQPSWRNIVLFAPDGRLLINTNVPFGTALPTTANPELVARVFKTRAPIVSDLFLGRVLQQPIVLAAVPIVHNDAPLYVLGAALAAKTLTDLLLQQKVPPDAIGTLLDRNKVIIARTREAERFVGQRGTPDLAARMDETAEGAFRLFTKDGQAVYAAISRSPRTGWTIALGVPQVAADAPLRSSLWILLLVGVVSALLGVLAAVHGARRITNPIASLSAAAAAELAAVGRELAATLDLTQVANRIVSALLELFRVRLATLFQVDCATDTLTCVAAAGPAGSAAWVGRRLEKGEGVPGRALTLGRLISSADIMSDPEITLPRWVRERSAEEGYGAVTSIPLRVRQQVLGVLSLGYEVGRVLTDEELQLLSTFADQAAIALEHARLHNEIQERLTQSETLLAVSKEISATLDSTEMMRLVAREVGHALGADMVGAFLADANHTYLRPIAGYHVPKHLLTDFMAFPIPLKGHRILEDAWEQRRPVASADVAADPRVNQEVLRRFPQRSSLFCPMIVHGEPIGGFFVTWFEQEHCVTPTELRLVEGISGQAGIALANARLVEALKTRQARLGALLEVGHKLSRIQPMETLLARIAEACGRVFEAHSVTFRLVEGEELVVCGNWGQAEELLTPARLKIGDSFAGIVAATGEPLVVRNPLSDPRLSPAHREGYRRHDIRAFLGVPVKIDDRVIGVLAVRTSRDDGFSTAEVEIAKAFASQAGSAFENSRLYQELQGTFQELSNTKDQLVQAQKMDAIGQLAGGIAHDFNNLLTVITGQSQLLLYDLGAEDPHRAKIELIQKMGQRAAELTGQLLAFSRKPVLQPKPLDLNGLVDGLAPMLRR